MPAPTSSAARRIPARRQASTFFRSCWRSSTFSRSVSSSTTRSSGIPLRWKIAFSSPGWNWVDSSVRGDRLTLMYVSASVSSTPAATISRQARSSSTVRSAASAAAKSALASGNGAPSVGRTSPSNPIGSPVVIEKIGWYTGRSARVARMVPTAVDSSATERSSDAAPWRPGSNATTAVRPWRLHQ